MHVQVQEHYSRKNYMKAVLSQENCAMPQLFVAVQCLLTFATSLRNQAPNARLQSYRHTGAKQNLT